MQGWIGVGAETRANIGALPQTPKYFRPKRKGLESGVEEDTHGGFEVAGFFGVQPVTGAGELAEARSGEEGFDLGAVCVRHVVGGAAGEEECRAGEGAGNILGPADDVGHFGLKHVEVQKPALVRDVERLCEEALQGGINACGCKLFGGVGAAGECAEVDAAHRVDEHGLGVCVGDWRDVGDDQAADQVGVGQREGHRRLAAHGMAAQIDGTTDVVDEFGEISGHVGVGLCGHARAVAVVAHVRCEGLAAVGQAFGDDAPVAARAKETVGDDQRGRVGRVAECGVIEHAAEVAGLRARGQCD